MLSISDSRIALMVTLSLKRVALVEQNVVIRKITRTVWHRVMGCGTVIWA